jgi:hypothetical protein
MKAHYYVVESSSEPYNVFADFFGPRREGFRFEHYVTCLQSLAKSASAFCTRQILFLPARTRAKVPSKEHYSTISGSI